MQDLVIVGTVADNPVVEDIAHHLHQHEDYSDLISLKSFLNTEFCPRFILSERTSDAPGRQLEGKAVLIVSTNQGGNTRDELAMRTFLLARAAKDNGADKVILLEPDLFYSAQDRGPRREHGFTLERREPEDYQKFDGQPFSARLYADLLKSSGVDEVVTVHNHSVSVQAIFMDRFEGRFHNLLPGDLYADYLLDSNVVAQKGLVLCAPDKGALDFVKRVRRAAGNPKIPLVFLDKCRKEERCVEIELSPDSEIALSELAGRDIVIIDDMVRTGNTIIEACRLIKSADPNRIVFLVTHFYSSRECRSNLNDPVLNEIVTTTTMPEVLNRDVQGRLRHKMVVLQLARWISNHLLRILQPDAPSLAPPLYSEDMSSKNPRWRGHMGPLFSAR
jgi:ribose-phosphate pyrophosphokinase